jgi:acyl-CoA synthetase (AMP-forming)/AMP-acid ligase II
MPHSTSSAGRSRQEKSANLYVLEGAPPQFSYLGARPLESVATSRGVGDLGYIDGDGYLFLPDPRVDQIITGGANVVPAEVEAVLTQHPGVRDAAVIGLKDDDLGRRAIGAARLPSDWPSWPVLRPQHLTAKL